MHRLRILTLGPLALLPLVAHCGGQPPPPPSPPRSEASSMPPAPPAPLLASVDEAALDPKTDPCDDFYQYACGGWLNAHPIPEDRSSYGQGAALADRIDERLRAILERDAAGQGGTDAYATKLGDYYAACMDEKAIEESARKDLDAELAPIAAVRDARSLTRAIARLHRIEPSIAFAVSAEPDFKDASKMNVALSQAGLGLPNRDYYFDDPKKPDPRKTKVRELYRAHVEATFALLGEPPADAKRDAKAVFDLETKLARASLDNVALRDPKNEYHLVLRKWLADNAKGLAWDDYFEAIGLKDVASLNAGQPEFLKALAAAVTGVPMADWRAYLRYHLVQATHATLSSKFVDEGFKYTQALGGAKHILPRWKRCVGAVDANMGEALGQPFAREALGDQGRAEARSMVDGVLEAMRADIAHLDWMDATTKKSAYAKIERVLKKVGYPDKWRSYDTLDVSRASYFTTQVNANAFELKRRLAKVGKPVDRDEWQMTPATVDAYYDPLINEIVFPAGILQPPFFSATASRGMNYGDMGSVIGHEVTHGFDDQGRQFDAAGSLVDWWSPGVGDEFDKRASCVASQYDGYTVLGDVHVNGKLTLGENIADLGGLKISWAAYKNAQKKSPSTAAYAVPEDKQFFVSYAQGWCFNARDERLHTMVSNDPHAPPKFRVNGVLANVPEFATTFACGAGKPMASHARCEVW